MTARPMPSNVIRFPVELVRLDTDVLFDIEPDYYAYEGMRIKRGDDEAGKPDYTFQDAEQEILPVVEALDRSDPTTYRAALKKLVADAVAAAVPHCRAFLPVEQEYLVRMQRHEKQPDSGFFERMFEDYRPVYEAHLEAAVHACRRVHGITRVVNFAREDKPWEQFGPGDTDWLIAAHLVATRR